MWWHPRDLRKLIDTRCPRIHTLNGQCILIYLSIRIVQPQWDVISRIGNFSIPSSSILYRMKSKIGKSVLMSMSRELLYSQLRERMVSLIDSSYPVVSSSNVVVTIQSFNVIWKLKKSQLQSSLSPYIPTIVPLWFLQTTYCLSAPPLLVKCSCDQGIVKN